jgi:hypothetical protein
MEVTSSKNELEQGEKWIDRFPGTQYKGPSVSGTDMQDKGAWPAGVR